MGAVHDTVASPLPAVASADAGAYGGVAGVGGVGPGLEPRIVTFQFVNCGLELSSHTSMKYGGRDGVAVLPSLTSIFAMGVLVSSAVNSHLSPNVVMVPLGPVTVIAVESSTSGLSTKSRVQPVKFAVISTTSPLLPPIGVCPVVPDVQVALVTGIVAA